MHFPTHSCLDNLDFDSKDVLHREHSGSREFCHLNLVQIDIHQSGTGKYHHQVGCAAVLYKECDDVRCPHAPADLDVNVRDPATP